MRAATRQHKVLHMLCSALIARSFCRTLNVFAITMTIITTTHQSDSIIEVACRRVARPLLLTQSLGSPAHVRHTPPLGDSRPDQAWKYAGVQGLQWSTAQRYSLGCTLD
jgi:hypothetical protein